ncbi:MAG: prolyl oligopeptidase family serine peptidase [Pseudomonadota bacterium]|nr:prolyl oligopeptidase family serine peptidase [Pseudomonadota bacterium]
MHTLFSLHGRPAVAITAFPAPVRRRWRAPLLAAMAALALAACGGSDDDPDGQPRPPVAHDAGRLMSSSQVNTFTAAQVTEGLSAPDSRIGTGVGIAPRYDVINYRLTYGTTDKDGAMTLASGLVSVPVKPAGARSPVLSYQHATTFHDNQAPANKVEAMEPPIVLASLGYIVVSPDYVGFGESKGKEHPYLTAAPTAAVVVDMLTAAQTWRQQQGVADNGQLFLAGYSEGGYATMAAHRAIHQAGGALKAQLRATAPGAGPYDVQETLDEQVRRIRLLLPVLGELFNPGLISQAPENVRQELRRLLMRQLVPEDGDVGYQTLFMDRFMADDRAAIAAEHSVHLGWAPDVPVYLFHGRGDLTVPYSASESALNTLRGAGAGDISLTDCTPPTGGHLDCVPEYFAFAVDRLGRLANDL